MKPVYAFVLLIAALPAALASCGPAPATTPTQAAATGARRPTATAAPPTPALSPMAWLGRLPEGTIALYGAGSHESRRLYALAADGSSTDLGRTVVPPAIASPGGGWVAAFDAPGRPGAVVIYDLREGGVYTIPCVSGCPGLNNYAAAWAFDPDESYLAFMELDRWALALVDLRDGSTRRFEKATWTGPEGIMPGIPLGWSSSGELVLDTYRPATESFSCGFWALGLPPDASPAPTGTLARRPLALPAKLRDPALSPEGSQVFHYPRVSPDGTRLAFLARDLAYEPAGYQPPDTDVAINQLWALDLASGEATCLVDVRDGGGLGVHAAWSPDGREVLFVQGGYAGPVLWPATLKVWEEGSTIREVGPLPHAGYLVNLDWCTPGTAVLATHIIEDVEDMPRMVGSVLHTVDLATGRTTQVAEAPFIQVLGCVR